MEGKPKMKNFLIINENNLAINEIVADSIEIVESMFPDKICIENVDLSAGIGFTYSNGVFTSPISETEEEDVPPNQVIKPKA